MWGPAWYLLLAAGMALAGNSAAGLGYGIAIAAVLISVWAWLLVRRRMAFAPSSFTCVTLVMITVAPFPVDTPPWMTPVLRWPTTALLTRSPVWS